MRDSVVSPPPSSLPLLGRFASYWCTTEVAPVSFLHASSEHLCPTTTALSWLLRYFCMELPSHFLSGH